MDRFKQIETFVAVATKGSLSAAAQAEGVAPAVIGRRMDALEERLGVRLLVRTTRKISLTFEGSAFLEDCLVVLRDFNDAEAAVAAGSITPTGHVRLTAPAGFGRKHVAPLLPRFIAQHPQVTVSLDLNDRLVDLVSEGFDFAVRVGDLADSNLVGTRLGDNRRVVVGAPSYFARAGKPQTPDDLLAHNCLAFGSSSSQSRGWLFSIDGQIKGVRVQGTLDCTDGTVLHEWALQGLGLAWRSLWEVGADLAAGRLVTVLDDYVAPPSGIHALYVQRKHLALRVRLLIDFLKKTYADPLYWTEQPTVKAAPRA